MDSDDLWYPTKLEAQLKFMQSHGYHFSYTNYEELNEAGAQTGVLVSGPKRITKTGMYDFCWPGCLTVMYDAEAVGLVQIADIRKNNDYAMWLKVCQKADCYLLDTCLAQYRRGRTGSISSHHIAAMVAWHYKLFRDAENESTIIATSLTARNLFWGLYKKIRYVKR